MRRVRQLLRLRGFQGAVPRLGHVDRLGLVTAWAMPPLDQPRGGGCEWPGGFAGLLSPAAGGLLSLKAALPRSVQGSCGTPSRLGVAPGRVCEACCQSTKPADRQRPGRTTRVAGIPRSGDPCCSGRAIAGFWFSRCPQGFAGGLDPSRASESYGRTCLIAMADARPVGFAEEWEYLEGGRAETCSLRGRLHHLPALSLRGWRRCITVLTCTIHQGLIPQGEHLAKRCCQWMGRRERAVGWCPEAGCRNRVVPPG